MLLQKTRTSVFAKKLQGRRTRSNYSANQGFLFKMTGTDVAKRRWFWRATHLPFLNRKRSKVYLNYTFISSFSKFNLLNRGFGSAILEHYRGFNLLPFLLKSKPDYSNFKGRKMKFPLNQNVNNLNTVLKKLNLFRANPAPYMIKPLTFTIFKLNFKNKFYIKVGDFKKKLKLKFIGKQTFSRLSNFNKLRIRFRRF
jgi:hypothetical protein